MLRSHHCPNCGANVEVPDAGAVTCRHCGSAFEVPRSTAPPAPAATAGSRKHLLLPPLGCCGIYVAVFLVGSLVLSAFGVSSRAVARNAVAAAAVVSAISGGVAIAWRLHKRP